MGVIMKILKYVVSILIAAILLIFFGATWYFSGEIVAFTPRSAEEIFDMKPFHDLADYGVSYEEVSFQTYEKSDTKEGEKLTLSGWFIPGRGKDAPVFIVLHGKGDSRVGVIKYAGMLARAGYAVLLYDHRHHGKSGGEMSTYGYYEGYDVSAAIDYLESRGDVSTKRLGVMGESFGAATAIIASARDKRIGLLIEDSSYPDLTTIIADFGKNLYNLPKFPLVYSALFVGGLRADFDASSVSPLDAIKEVTVPTLILHCDADPDIKPEYSKLMYDASPAETKELHYFSGCGHTLGYEDHTDEYEGIVLDFIEKNVP